MTTAPDPFDALRADDTPITPPAPVVARVRDLLTTELERLMTDTTPATTTTGRRTVPADLHTVGTGLLE